MSPKFRQVERLSGHKSFHMELETLLPLSLSHKGVTERFGALSVGGNLRKAAAFGVPFMTLRPLVDLTLARHITFTSWPLGL